MSLQALLRVARPASTAMAIFCLATGSGCTAKSVDYARYDPGTAQDEVAEQAESFNQRLALVASRKQGNGEYEIGPEDLIEVTLFDIETRDGIPQVVSARVSGAGFVTLPHVGQLEAAGLTPIQLEQRLRDVYSEFIHEPQITVFVREYHSYQVAVVGYVNKPDVLQLRGRRSLLEALALAGGLNDEAGRTVRLIRETEQQLVTEIIDLDKLTRLGNLDLNPTLLPNDVINVPRAGVFYVEGAVLKPGAYPLLQQTTVSQAVATAGGTDSALSNDWRMTIYRKRDEGLREAIGVDIGAIRRGEIDDIALLEDDVVVIPVSGPKWLFDRLLTAVRIGVNYRP